MVGPPRHRDGGGPVMNHALAVLLGIAATVMLVTIYAAILGVI